MDWFKRKLKPTRAVASADPEVDGLRAEIAAKQARAAELQGDLVESLDGGGAFQVEFVARVGVLARRATALRAELEAARRAAFQRLWESQPDATPYVDVTEQFRRAWEHTPTGGPPPPPPPTTSDEEAQIKNLFRELARRYHPDLAATEAEREWRTPRMALVNAAYAARDLAALQALAEAPEDDSRPMPRLDSRAALIASLRRESARLDEVIERLERELDELTYSPALKLQLDVKMARRAGRDLLGEAEADLRREIAGLEKDLRQAGGR